MARRNRDGDRTTPKRRRRGIREQIQESFGDVGDEPPTPDGAGKVLEAFVALLIGTGFWRLVVSDSWVVSVVFGVLLAALLYSYGLFRARMVERSREGGGNDPRRR